MGACYTRPGRTCKCSCEASEAGGMSPIPYMHEDPIRQRGVNFGDEAMPEQQVVNAVGSEGGNRADSEVVEVSKKTTMDRSQFILENPSRFRDVYSVDKDKVMGEGTYGAVRKGRHRQTGQLRAIKTIPKEHARKLERFKQEVAFMKLLDHPNIIKLFETFEDDKAIYLVMELCLGGELFERIIEAGRFTEAQAAGILQQILRAVNYMHDRGVCHRDIKPENFLFLNKEPIEKSILKIIDFGLSCKVSQQPLKTKAGTPYYVAPEVLQGSYDESCDLWSCGVIMYTLLCGYPPFWGKTDAEVLAKVRRASYSFEAKHWKHITEDAKNLVRRLLTLNPKDRFTAKQALEYTWIKGKAPQAPIVSLDASFVENLRGFRAQNRLKKAALNVIAGQLQEDKVQKLRDAFVAFDVNGDGLLTLEELRAGLRQAGFEGQLSANVLQRIVEDVDANGSGLIDYTEFLAAGIDKALYLDKDICYSAFRVFDVDGDGKITPQELSTLLSSTSPFAASSQVIGELLHEVDTDGDGTVSFDEFMMMMRGGAIVDDARNGTPVVARTAGA